MRMEKIIVMLIFLISCNNNDIKLINTNNAIPSSSDVIIKINSWSNFDKKIQNIDWWKKLFEQENFDAMLPDLIAQAEKGSNFVKNM